MRIDLPPEFDPAYYSRMRPYLPPNPELLRREYELYGKKSGAPGSFFCYRENVLKIFGKIAGPVLEIGPGHAPDFVGENVRYLDIVSGEEFSAQNPDVPERNGGMGVPDYGLDDLAHGRIAERFDLVYSAHNFEHQANCVMHLNSIAGILNPGGYFVAVIPDRNFTFDYYRSASTLIDILSAPKSQTRHSIRTAMSSRITTLNDSVRHWLGEHGESRLSDESAVESWIKGDDTELKSQHVNTFAPDSFRSIFGILSDKGVVELELLRVYDTPFPRNEFVTIFRKGEK